MEVTQINIKDTTDEEFIAAFKKNKIKFKGTEITFDNVLQVSLQKDLITMERAIDLQLLWKNEKENQSY